MPLKLREGPWYHSEINPTQSCLFTELPFAYSLGKCVKLTQHQKDGKPLPLVPRLSGQSCTAVSPVPPCVITT